MDGTIFTRPSQAARNYSGLILYARENGAAPSDRDVPAKRLPKENARRSITRLTRPHHAEAEQLRAHCAPRKWPELRLYRPPLCNEALERSRDAPNRGHPRLRATCPQ